VMRRRRGAEGGGSCAGGGPERDSVTEALGGGWCNCSGAQGVVARRFGGGSCSAAPINGGLTAAASRSGAEDCIEE
jgi:hypothetical protein